MLYVVGKVVLSSIELHLIHCDILISTKVIKVLIKSMLAAIFSRWRPSATGEPRGTFFPGTTHQGLSSLKNSACIKFCSGCFLHWLDYEFHIMPKCLHILFFIFTHFPNSVWTFLKVWHYMANGMPYYDMTEFNLFKKKQRQLF